MQGDGRADACATCGGTHPELKYEVGDRVRVLAMMPHILKYNPFGDPVVDRAGHEGVVVRADRWERIGATSYIVNFNPDPDGAWWAAPFHECQLEPASQKEVERTMDMDVAPDYLVWAMVEGEDGVEFHGILLAHVPNRDNLLIYEVLCGKKGRFQFKPWNGELKCEMCERKRRAINIASP